MLFLNDIVEILNDDFIVFIIILFIGIVMQCRVIGHRTSSRRLITFSLDCLQDVIGRR